MSASRHALKPLALAAGLMTATAASAAPITFQLNNDSGVGGTTGDGSLGTTSLVLSNGGLTLTLGALGDTATDIGEGGSTSQSGLGVFSSGGGSSNQLEKTVAGTDVNEGFSFRFTDGSGANVAVEFNAVEFALFRGSDGDQAQLNVGAFSQAINGGPNNGSFSFSLATSPELAAGSTGSILANAGDGFRFRSVTVEVVPEPASLALASAGAVLLLGRRRRQA